MSIADDITGVFNSVSDTVANVSTDVQTSAASIGGIQNAFSQWFGDKTKGVSSTAPKANTHLVLIGLILLGIAFALKIIKVK